MSWSFKLYTALWIGASGWSLWLMIIQHQDFSLLGKAYFRYLGCRWRVITFLIAAAGNILIAPYTGDPTWDYFDAAYMSILAFYTAPWAIGTIYLFILSRSSLKTAFVACCLWLFTASWSYDIYIYLRDGLYPETWFANLFASSAMYILAGLFWSLEFRRDRGVTFWFLEGDLFHCEDTAQFGKLFWFALPFMILASMGVLYFIV